MKMLFIVIFLISTTFFPMVHAFEETLPDHAHRICLGNGEGAWQDAEIYLGCVLPGMGIEAGNWTNIKIPALGHSYQMVSTATDGKNWYMANTSVSDQYIFIGTYKNPQDSNAPNSTNWSNTDLRDQMGKSNGGVGLAYDQNRWCMANTTGDSPYNVYIGCTTNLENVGNAKDWKNSDISSTQGKSRGAVDLATDGINWAMSGTEQNSYKIHVSVMVNPSKDVLDAKNWKDINLSDQLGEASTPMDIATDGKRWCIANTTGGGDKEIYIGCTTEQGLDPAVATHWQNVNLKDMMGKSDSGLSLATDGIVWCMGNTTGGGDQSIYLGCTRPGTDPLVVANWYNINLKDKMGKSVQGADVAFYRSCYYPGEKPSTKNATNHGCCEGIDYNSETERCELPDFPPDVKDWVATTNTGCQQVFADDTKVTFSEVARRLRLFHLMFANDKPVGLANMSTDQQDKYLTDMIDFIELPKDYKNIQYGQSKGGAPVEMGDALIEVATFQKETLKEAYQEYDTRLKTLANAQEMLIEFMKKGADKITAADQKEFGETMCKKLFPDSSSRYRTQGQGEDGAKAKCLTTYAPAPQTMALILDEQSLNNQSDFYKEMEFLFTKTQVLFENVTRLAKNETWNCSHSTTMQCGSKRVFDMDEKVFYINPLFPHHHDAYGKLGIKTTTIFSGNPKDLRGTKAISGDKIKALKAWYESKAFTDLEGKEYYKILAMLMGESNTEGSGSEPKPKFNTVGLPALSEHHQAFLDSIVGSPEAKGAFDFFQMLTQYRIMTNEEVAKEKLPASALMPPLLTKKVFFRKDLMAYVIDLEIMNNFLVTYFQTGSQLASNQSTCVGDVAQATYVNSGGAGGAGFIGITSTELASTSGPGDNPVNGGVNGEIVSNGTLQGNGGISAFGLGTPGNGGQVALGGDYHSSSYGGGNLTGGGGAALNALRNHMKKRAAKFLKYKSTKAGQNFAKNVKDGLESYNKRVASAMKSGAGYNAGQMAATSAGLGAPTAGAHGAGDKGLDNGAGQNAQDGHYQNPTSSNNGWTGNSGGSFSDSGSTLSSNNENPSGLTDEDKSRLLSNIQGSDYSTNEGDSLFEIISKRYMTSGIPRLLMNRKKPPK